MATNLAIDLALLDRAVEVSGERTEKAVVTKALQEFIARREQRRAIELMGKLEWDEVLRGERSMVTRIRKPRPEATDTRPDTDAAIQPENINAVATIYVAYQLEELRIFRVVDRLVELFGQGQLPIRRGRAGDLLRRYSIRSAERITDAERRELYARVFGAPGGAPEAEPNRDFDALWLRFVSSVSDFARQLATDPMPANVRPAAITQEPVRKAGRDLAANLSLHGHGLAHAMAAKLQQTLVDFRDVLQNTELRNAFGARDMWSVIDRVNADQLGGARNTHRHRTQGQAGAVIIRWLAENLRRLVDADAPVLSAEVILDRRSGGGNPTRNPNDHDLVDACEQWLVSATGPT